MADSRVNNNVTPSASAMTEAALPDIEHVVAELQRQVTALREALDRMATGVTGREMLSRGDFVVRLGSARTDTAGVRVGQTNSYVSGATVIDQTFDGTAWRSVTKT